MRVLILCVDVDEGGGVYHSLTLSDVNMYFVAQVYTSPRRYRIFVSQEISGAMNI